MPEFRYSICEVSDILKLRREELRTGMPSSTAHFSCDDNPETIHFGAFLSDGSNVACITATPDEHPAPNVWQLRAMAVSPRFRGSGVASGLMKYVEEYFYNKGVNQLWCNARERAIPFYLRLGWQIDSDWFHISSIGPHKRMIKKLI